MSEHENKYGPVRDAYDTDAMYFKKWLEWQASALTPSEWGNESRGAGIYISPGTFTFTKNLAVLMRQLRAEYSCIEINEDPAVKPALLKVAEFLDRL